MAVRLLRTDGDQILRKVSREVTKIDDRIKVLIEDMFETMDVADGVGLAAPQVGILRRVITVDDRESSKFAMINPVIVEKNGSELGIEGCLSVPGKQGEVERCTEVLVEYIDADGIKREMRANGFLARILQHEIDHLDGILYIDKAKVMYGNEIEQGE